MLMIYLIFNIIYTIFNDLWGIEEFLKYPVLSKLWFISNIIYYMYANNFIYFYIKFIIKIYKFYWINNI